MNEQPGLRQPDPPTQEDVKPVAQSEQVPILAMRRISKSFDRTMALDSLDLTINRGEVVALVGQNGSGKSTLVKILSGYHEPEPGGELSIDGVDVPLPVPPGEATEIGLSFVYQDLALADSMTVLENLNLGSRIRHGVGAWQPIWWRREHREGRVVLKRYDVSLDLDARAGDLAPVDQARLAIVRSAHALRRFQTSRGDHASILVLDEPTVFLPADDIRFLFHLIKTIVNLGGSVLFISHDLAAVREIADRIVVLRDGRKVAETLAGELDEDELVNLIVGAVTTRAPGTPRAAVVPADAISQPPVNGALSARPVASPASTRQRGEAAIKIGALAGGRLQEFSLTVAAGEIVGLAGLVGSGAEDVPYLLFGSEPATAGTLTIGNDTLSLPQLTPSEAVRKRVALIPADRKQFGLGLELDVWENMSMLIQDGHFRRGLFHRDELVKIAKGAVVEFGIKPPRVDLPASALSGGNQQKLLLAKWLLAHPRLMIAHEPTQGVDVGARQDIYRIVRRASAAEAMAVIWVTTDFTELEQVCTRVVIVSRGRQSGELQGDEISEESITAAVLRQYEEAV
ncbi:MAG: sugar ABC transporter ATP-binding protein [Acidimicrobiales bacterium]